jgi:hypothetical protein
MSSRRVAPSVFNYEQAIMIACGTDPMTFVVNVPVTEAPPVQQVQYLPYQQYQMQQQQVQQQQYPQAQMQMIQQYPQMQQELTTTSSSTVPQEPPFVNMQQFSGMELPSVGMLPNIPSMSLPSTDDDEDEF